MDQWKLTEGFFQGIAVAGVSDDRFRPDGEPAAWSGSVQVPCSESSQRMELEAKDSLNARKVHKADREKLRRDRLNEQFLELGNAIDPDRPKNDKATMIGDAIQMLKDLAAQVHKLKAEHAYLSEESRELIREKNELREEKSALRTEIDTLNALQHGNRLGCLYPWPTVDASAIMAPLPSSSAYPFPIPVPVPSGPIPFHAPIPLYPFFQNPNPYASSSGNPYYADQHPILQLSQSRTERSADFSDVVTELELKMPGSANPSSNSKSANSCTEERGGCQHRSKGNKTSDECGTSDRSPFHPRLPASSFNSNEAGSVADS